MVALVSRISNVGVLSTSGISGQGIFDEVSLAGANTTKRLNANGIIQTSGILDEVSIQGNTTTMREFSNGNLAVSGSFDEVTGPLVTNGLVLNVAMNKLESYTGGSTITDLTRTETTAGTLIGSPSYTTGNNGYLKFNGSSQYITFPGTSSLGLDAQSKTMTAWISPTSYPTSPVCLVDKENGSTGWGFWINSSGKLWYWPQANNDAIDNGALSLTTNTWNHATIVWNNSTNVASFYYNGALSSSVNSSGGEVASLTTVPLYIAWWGRGGTGEYFAGNIGEIQLYNRTLSSGEILNNYNAGASRYGLPYIGNL